MIRGEPIRIVVLYAEIVGYVVGMLKALLKCDREMGIDVVYWDKKHINSSRFVVEQTGSVRYHPRSSLTDGALLELLQSRLPHIVYVSGWMDKGYLRAIGAYRSAGGAAQVVCGLDDQWKGTFRQHAGQVYFRLFYARLFDFMWVSGKPQYHFAQRLGYNHERIISNLYSADSDIFDLKARVSRRFVFIGRFDPVKALDLLVEAYRLLPEEIQKNWPLVLIGDGQLKEKIKEMKNENILIKPFMQPVELKKELMNGGVSCIPSYSEQWGVAIHEMALIGYPFVLSSACGAATEFLISGYNGFLFRRGSVESLCSALRKMTDRSNDELELYSARSRELGERISVQHVAYSLLSVLELSEL